MFITTAEETYQDGQVIFEEGSHGDWIYLIESGSIELSKKIGGKKIIIETLKEGEVFGELGFLTKTPRTATAVTVGETTIGILDRKFLDEEFNRLSNNFQTILRSLALRLEKTTMVACQTILRRRDQRVSKVLNLHFKSEEELIKAYSENLSAGGLFINTKRPLPQGERFLLKLFLPHDPEPLKIESEVAWSRNITDDPKGKPPGMGVKFIQIGANDTTKLKKVLGTGTVRLGQA